MEASPGGGQCQEGERRDGEWGQSAPSMLQGSQPKEERRLIDEMETQADMQQSETAMRAHHRNVCLTWLECYNLWFL